MNSKKVEHIKRFHFIFDHLLEKRVFDDWEVGATIIRFPESFSEPIREYCAGLSNELGGLLPTFL